MAKPKHPLNLNHRFYIKTKKEQNKILFRIAVMAISIILLGLLFSIYIGIYIIGILIAIITLSIVAPFFDMPALRKSGRMVYYSLLFIAEKPKNATVNIHGGTLFDYYFVIDSSLSSRQRTTFILQQYVEGLLALMTEYENDKQLKIRGTSYVINGRTAEKIGFKIVKTDALQNFILVYNYFNVLASNSIAKNKLAFPKLTQIKTFEAELSQLIAKKEFIEKLNKTLQKSIADNT